MIAAIIPTIRPEKYEKRVFASMATAFDKHNVKVYKVVDGDKPTVNGLSVSDVMGGRFDLIHNFNDGVRNLGFAKAYKDGAGIFIKADDDTLPLGDTIQDHLDALDKEISDKLDEYSG